MKEIVESAKMVAIFMILAITVSGSIVGTAALVNQVTKDVIHTSEIFIIVDKQGVSHTCQLVEDEVFKLNCLEGLNE